MSKKTIYEYDGQEFVDYDELEEYVANLTGGEYNNADPYDTPSFYEAMEEVERREVEWHINGYHEEISNAIKPILNSIEIEVHTTLNKINLNKLIKELQIAVNRINKKGFYGK
jgi:hypothetical protein